MVRTKKSDKKLAKVEEEMGLTNPLNQDLGSVLKYADLAGITIGGTFDHIVKAFNKKIPFKERWEYGSKGVDTLLRIAMATEEALKQFSSAKNNPTAGCAEPAEEIERLRKENAELKNKLHK
jgi:hypothetical protein